MNKYNELLQEVIEQARKINIPVSIDVDPTITINTRAKGRFGQCKKRNGKYLIEISQYLTQAEDKYIKETLAHEILHTCPDCMNHGREWKYYVSRMNYNYGYNISRTNSCANMGIVNPRIENAKYIITCKTCGKKIYKQREAKVVKNIDRYHCKCGGRLEVCKVY
jgi:predicted SprT family Zn-dependent metalloprotease